MRQRCNKLCCSLPYRPGQTRDVWSRQGPEHRTPDTRHIRSCHARSTDYLYSILRAMEPMVDGAGGPHPAALRARATRHDTRTRTPKGGSYGTFKMRVSWRPQFRAHGMEYHPPPRTTLRHARTTQVCPYHESDFMDMVHWSLEKGHLHTPESPVHHELVFFPTHSC
jgi:hypothetical protein